MSNFLQDTNEPVEIFNLIRPVVEVSIEPLNANGYADYRWIKQDSNYKHVERKTWGELLSNLDKVEEQLLRHLTKLSSSGEVVFLLEGVVKSTPDNSVVTMNQVKNGMMVKGHSYKWAKLTQFYAWLYEVGKYCEILYTTGLQETATALCAMYKADQKLEHTTFHRTIKQVEFSPDPRVTTLMGIVPGLGHVRATALIAKYGTPWNVLSAGWHGQPTVGNKYDLTDIPGIGNGIVDNLFRTLGRPDV